MNKRSAKPVRCLILGGGGHARVVLDALLASGAAMPYAILDRNQSLWGQSLLGVPVRGGDDLLPQLVREGVTHFVVGIGGVKDNRPRHRLFDMAVGHGLTPLTVIHPTGVCSTWATVGDGCVILPTAVVNAGATLGRNVIVNSGAIVEHDCTVGDHVHVATGARLASTVRVGAEAHVGAGATVRQCVSIGEGAVVGAGAVVVEDIQPWVVVVGVPARPIGKVSPTTASPQELTKVLR